MVDDLDFKKMYEKSMRRLTVMSHISETIALENDSDNVWEKVLKEIVNLMGASTGSIYMIREDSKGLYCTAEYSEFSNTRLSIIEDLDFSFLKDMPIMDVLVHGKSNKNDNITYKLEKILRINDEKVNFHYKSAISSPIRIGFIISGTITVSSITPNCFSDDDVKVLESIGHIIGTTFYNDKLLKELRKSKEALERALNNANNARIEERRSLSRELHDDIGQRLTSLSLRLKAIQQEQDLDVVSDRLNNARYLANGANEALRRISNALRPTILEENSMFDSLQKLIHEVSCDSGIPILLKVPKEPFDMKPDIELTIYRCIQECVTNIIKHSMATIAWITISMNDGNIILEIKDNGIGLPEKENFNGSGIIGMKERVFEVRGLFNIDTSKTSGTTILVILPNN